VTQAQQSEQIRRVGVLMNRAADDPDGQTRLNAFLQGLQQLGWIDGRNVRIDVRWGEDKIDRERKYAAELVALAPDIVMASGAPSVAALQHQLDFADCVCGRRRSSWRRLRRFTRPAWRERYGLYDL